MTISTNNVLRDYQALRQAASQGRTNAPSEIVGQDLAVISSRIDNDPATVDTIVAGTIFNQGMSYNEAKLTFVERQQEGKSVLEFSARQPVVWGSEVFNTSSALIDLESGFLIASAGTGNYVVAKEVAPTPVPGPVGPSQEQEAAKIRTGYAELKEAMADQEVGDLFYLDSVDKDVTLEKSEPGLVQISYWGGSNSGNNSGTFTDIYREFPRDGKAALEFTQKYSGDFGATNSSERTLTICLEER